MADHARTLRTIERWWDANQPLEWAVTTTASDLATHTAKVRIHPSQQEYGPLPIASPPGLRLMVPSGTPCRVSMDRGAPTEIVSVHYTAGPVPNVDMAISGPAYFSGPVTLANLLTLLPTRTAGAPTTGTHAQGEMMMDANGALHVCIQSGVPGAWRTVTVT